MYLFHTNTHPTKRIADLLIAIMTFYLFCMPTNAAANPVKPNILLIIADDMGLDASYCYNVGHTQARMPVVEALCRQGMVFENVYAAPTCSPTRATILTGRYGFRTGVGSAITQAGGNGVSQDEESLFDVLASQGYASAVIGKWHVSDNNQGLDHPAQLGVSEYYGTYRGAVSDYFEWEGVHNGKLFRANGYTTTMFTERAIDWIAAQDSPWFLWLAYNAPHAPFHLPPAELHTAKNLTDDAAAIQRDPRAYYNAMLEAMDTEIGRLLNTMSTEVRNNLIVIFIGDNGTPRQVADQIYGERGSKGSIFEGGTHVPMVVQGHDVAVGRSDALVNSTDLFATITSLSGARSEAADSIDLSPTLQGGVNSRLHAYVEHFSPIMPRGPDIHGWAIRDARYKLLEIRGQTQMLFDLQSDPFEHDDLLSGDSAYVYSRIAEYLNLSRDALARNSIK